MKDKFEELIGHLLEGGFFLEQAVEILETGLIRRALEKTRGNRSSAAKLLGIHRNTLQRKMAEYEIEPSRPRRKPMRRHTATRKRARLAG